MRAKLPLILTLFGALLAATIVWSRQNINFQKYAQGIVSSPVVVLKNDSGRTNIALLGIGGEGHEGGELTDSILVASIKHDTREVTLISIPRDVWIQNAKTKINAVYYYADKAEPGSGLTHTQEAISTVLGIPIHYSLLVDFSGFIKAIDAVGGINVTVDRSFDDYKYPIPGKENVEPESDRYEHLHFDAGPMHMDGVTALKYVRSRHSLGDEGTDFARGVRQQKVIRAFLGSLISRSTIFNTERINTLRTTLNKSVKTNIPIDLSPAFTKLAVTIDFDTLKNITIENELINPKNLAPYGGAWVLLPKTNWEDLHAYIQNKLQTQ